jgi:Sulfotransferase domain
MSTSGSARRPAARSIGTRPWAAIAPRSTGLPCNFYEALAARYPGARVILTVRDPERWYESARQTIFPRITRSIAKDQAALLARARMQRKVVIEQAFGGDITDREHVLAVFRRHIEEVQRTVPPERLLVYDVAEGWDPLCNFLGQPVPDESFPHVNASDEFRRRFRD